MIVEGAKLHSTQQTNTVCVLVPWKMSTLSILILYSYISLNLNISLSLTTRLGVNASTFSQRSVISKVRFSSYKCSLYYTFANIFHIISQYSESTSFNT